MTAINGVAHFAQPSTMPYEATLAQTLPNTHIVFIPRKVADSALKFKYPTVSQDQEPLIVSYENAPAPTETATRSDYDTYKATMHREDNDAQGSGCHVAYASCTN